MSRRRPPPLSEAPRYRPVGLGASLALHGLLVLAAVAFIHATPLTPDQPAGAVDMVFAPTPEPAAAVAAVSPPVAVPTLPAPDAPPPPLVPEPLVPEPPPPTPVPPPPVPAPPPPSPPPPAPATAEPPPLAMPPPPPVPIAKPAPRPAPRPVPRPPQARPPASSSASASAVPALHAAPPVSASAAPAGATRAPPAGPALVPAHPVAGLAGNEKPAYPPAALRRGEQGSVVVRVAIGPDGRPVSASIDRSSGHDLLDEAAVSKVLRDWRFVPATRDGTPVAGSALVPFSFRIGE